MYNINSCLRNMVEYRVKHIYCKAKLSVDGHAKMGVSSLNDLNVFLDCPQEVYEAYVANPRGTSHMRSVVI